MFDRYEDVERALEHKPVKPEPPAHAFAREQLRQAGVKTQEVCVALPDSIVYRGPTGQVITAWTKVVDGKFKVLSTDPGMPAWPSRGEE